MMFVASSVEFESRIYHIEFTPSFFRSTRQQHSAGRREFNAFVFVFWLESFSPSSDQYVWCCIWAWCDSLCSTLWVTFFRWQGNIYHFLYSKTKQFAFKFVLFFKQQHMLLNGTVQAIEENVCGNKTYRHRCCHRVDYNDNRFCRCGNLIIFISTLTEIE